MQKLHKIKVDISKKYAMPAFEVNTNDFKSIRLSIEVLSGASPLDLTDKTVRIAIRKPDNNIVFQDCEVKDAATGQVEVILENQAYTTPGTHTAEIMCYKGSDVVAVSGTFSYKSTKGIMNDEAVESKSEFTAINRTLNEAERILEDLRENGGGAGVDQQARQKIEEVTTQLADIGTDAVKKVATGDLTTTGRSKLPAVISFITDDGFKEEYTILKPIFQNAGIPLAHALISGWIGKDNRCMTVQQALELQSMGHEIMSHTVDHLELSQIPEAEAETQLKNSKSQLEKMGFNIESIVYPYGAMNRTIKRLARKYYRSGYNFHNGSEQLNTPPYNTYEIKRMALGSYFDSTSDKYPVTNTFEGYYKKRVDELNASGGWLIITLHPGASSKEFTPQQQQYLVDTINHIKSLNIPVMNPRDVLNQTGNVIDAEGYPLDEKEERFFRMGANGKIESNEIGVTRSYPKDSFNAKSPYSAFPANIITHNIVSSNNAEGTPNNIGGLLITDRTNTLSFGDTASNLNFQTFRERPTATDSGKVYFRSTLGAAPYNWGPWIQGNMNFVKQDTYTFATPASSFPDGVITQNVVGSSNLTGSPNNVSGVLITDRTSGAINFVYQTFKERSPDKPGPLPGSPGVTYTRNTAGNGNWLPWRKLSSELIPGTAAPTTGTYDKGDRIYNSNPAPGSYLGWVCVTAGTPGTWKGFGLIES